MANDRWLVDTNVFLRFVTGDDPIKAEECRLLFERAAAGTVEIHTTHLALAEVAWTLLSYYRQPREQVAALLRDILAIPGLRIDSREMLVEVTRLFESSNVDYIDAYHAVDFGRRGLAGCCSYDEDFDRLDVPRVEPGQLID